MSVSFSVGHNSGWEQQSALRRDWKKWAALADQALDLGMREAAAHDLLVTLRPDRKPGRGGSRREALQLLAELDPSTLSKAVPASARDALTNFGAALQSLDGELVDGAHNDVRPAIEAAAADLRRRKRRAEREAAKLKLKILSAPTTSTDDLAIKLDVSLEDDPSFGHFTEESNPRDQQVIRAMLASVRQLLPDFEFSSLRRNQLTDTLDILHAA